MNHEAAVREFLRTRRDRLTPEQAGLIGGGRRRLPGLRREEVSMLAGVSVDYYAKMERGKLGGVSPEVLGAVARALQLDEAEIAHLNDLAAAAARPPSSRLLADPSIERAVRPSLQLLLDAIAAPAWIMDEGKDYLATNALGRALLAPLFDDPVSRGNSARFIFLSPAARPYFRDWEQVADISAASLRTAAGRSPRNRELAALIDELSGHEEFRTRWSQHNVRLHLTGMKRIHHPEAGDLEFLYEGLQLPDIPDAMLWVYLVEPGSPTEERVGTLKDLAGLA